MQKKEFVDQPFSLELLELLEEKAEHTVLSTKGTEEMKCELGTYQVPRFVYPKKVRIKAAELLKERGKENKSWGDQERTRLSSKLETLKKETFGEDLEGIEKLKSYELPRNLYRWLQS